MNRVLGYGLVLLAAVGMARLGAAETSGLMGDAGFFYAGAGSSTKAQGYLGVDVRNVSEDELGTLKLKDTHGAEIVLVDHDAPAGKAGLREHDVVLQMNGQTIQNEEQVRKMLRESPPGTPVVLVISRDGQPMTITTQMANREVVERQAWQQHLTMPDPQAVQTPADEAGSSFSTAADAPAMHAGNSFLGAGILLRPAYTGAMLETISKQLAKFFGVPDGGGLLVRSVEDNSPAAAAGLRAGDVVVRVDERKVSSTGDWTKAVKGSRGRPLSVVVLRDRKEQTLTLTPNGKKRSALEGLPGMGARWTVDAEEASVGWGRELIAAVR